MTDPRAREQMTPEADLWHARCRERIATLERENSRLRGALERISEDDLHWRGGGGWARQRARLGLREALAGTQDEEVRDA